MSRHIYVGLSHRVYCAARLGTPFELRERIQEGRLEEPVTEGEYVDGIVRSEELCVECVEAIVPVRGRQELAGDA